MTAPLPSSGTSRRPPGGDPCRDLGWDLGVVFRAQAKAAREAMADLPGGPRGFHVLTAAAEGDRQGTQAAIARRLGIDRTVMTYLLDDLEAAGLVRRTPDPSDRRARLVTVTAAGTTLLDDLARRMSVIEDELLEGLTPEERQALRSGLRRVATRLDLADPVTDRCALVRELDA